MLGTAHVKGRLNHRELLVVVTQPTLDKLYLLLQHKLVHHPLVQARLHHRRPANARLIRVLLNRMLPGRRLVAQRQVGAPVKLRLVRVVALCRAARPLNPLYLLVDSGDLAVGPVVDTRVEFLLFSQLRLLQSLVAVVAACDALALRHGFPHSELLRDEAVLDDLVYVFLLRERTLVIQVQIPHLLADVGLVH